MDFEWDARKAESNLAKHGISFKEASTAFLDSLSMMMPDPVHASEEERYILIGGFREIARSSWPMWSVRIASGSSAPGRPRRESGGVMRKEVGVS
jgi:uncharacterized DUF497 family protein